jgi:DNA invertase Pin-like site-specific DNA recombinase
MNGRGVTAVAKTKGKRVVLYLRVSTSEQTTHNQRRELLAVAARHKWEVVGVFEDAGISGAKGREQRPGLDAMMKVVTRREVDMVAAWSVDRLGPIAHRSARLPRRTPLQKRRSVPASAGP